MNRICLYILVLIPLVFSASAWGNCPQDSFDRGICDSMYVEPWSADVADSIWLRPGPYFVRVPIYITADVVDYCDSINGFVFPMCFTHSNPSRYCSISSYLNSILWTPSSLPRSIFRHLAAPAIDTIHNWMMDLFNAGNGEEWNGIVLNLDGTSHFWLAMIPYGREDPWFGSGSRILLATMTFKVQDTMQICVDTCFWPRSNRLGCSVREMSPEGNCGYSFLKIPRMGTPHDSASYKTCFNLGHFINHPPNAFSLLLPNNNAISPPLVHFDWQNATDPDSGDLVKYDLHISTFFKFLPEYTTIDSNITQSQYTKVLSPGTYYWKVKAKDSHGGTRWSSENYHFTIRDLEVIPGDFNKDKSVDVGDVVFAVNYLFKSDMPPDPLEIGDCNCDNKVNVGDVVYLINYLFKSGLLPGCQR